MISPGIAALRALFFCLLLVPFSTLACGLEQVESRQFDGGVEVTAGFSDQSPAVGEFTLLEIHFCLDDQPLSVESLEVNADMPAHGHGMNYQTQVVTQGKGKYLVEGLLFHMPGEWRIRIDFSRQQSRYQVETWLTL